MKTKLILLTLAFAASLTADTLKTDTAVFVQTDPKSPVLTRLKAGSTITVVGEAPAGWRRVEVSGPFEAYAQSRDITKGLEVREGGSMVFARGIIDDDGRPVLAFSGSIKRLPARDRG